MAIAGSLLHYAWEWSGGNSIVAVFAAINESTWEHLKLAFWPALGLGVVQRRVYDAPPGWLVATALRCAIPPAAIVLLFYGYVAITGENHLVGDIAVFLIAILAGEHVGHGQLDRRFGNGMRLGAGALLIALIAAFAVFTFQPPDFFLFEAPALTESR